MLGITDDNNIKKNKGGKRKRRGVTFNDEECIINPEDIDPNVGRFRNLVQTTIVPSKRNKYDTNYIGVPSTSTTSASDMAKHLHPTSFMPHLYQDLPPTADRLERGNVGGRNANNSGNSNMYAMENDASTGLPTLGSKLGLLLPNPAPEVYQTTDTSVPPPISFGVPTPGILPVINYISFILIWILKRAIRNYRPSLVNVFNCLTTTLMSALTYRILH